MDKKKHIERALRIVLAHQSLFPDNSNIEKVLGRHMIDVFEGEIPECAYDWKLFGNELSINEVKEIDSNYDMNFQDEVEELDGDYLWDFLADYTCIGRFLVKTLNVKRVGKDKLELQHVYCFCLDENHLLHDMNFHLFGSAYLPSQVLEVYDLEREAYWEPIRIRFKETIFDVLEPESE